MEGKKVLQQLSAYKQGMQISDVKKEFNLHHIVKLASNENPYGCSERMNIAIQEMEKDFEIYPDGYVYDLRVKLAKKLGVEKDQLVFGAGSDEIITFICRAFLYEGTNTVMAAPTFPQYRHHALIEGASLKEIPTVEGKHDLEQMAEAIDEFTKVVWLCTPDNPTGTVISQMELDTFMKKIPNNVVVVLDEAYYEFVHSKYQFDLLENLKKYPNLIILRTFSKIYGIAGLRVGYAISSESLAEKLNIVRGPFNTNSFGQRVASYIVDDDDFIETTKKNNNRIRGSFQQFLDEINWDYYSTETNFILVKTPIDADVVAHYLLQHGFIVRSGNVLGYPKTIRITIGKHKDMEELQIVIQRLEKEIRDGVIQ